MPGYIVGTGIDFIVNLVRSRISDLKVIYNTVTSEDAGIATGVDNEIFSTDNTPIASGFNTYFRAGRWYYSAVGTDAETSGKRAYVFNVESGYFRLPLNSVKTAVGDRVKIGYTWLEEQPYKFSDDEIKMYIGDAVTVVNNSWYNFGHSFFADATNDTFSITPMPSTSEIAPYLYAQYASYLIKKQLESEGFGDRIYVRDINITIDTSKGLGDLQKSAKDLLRNFESIINELKVKGQEAAFARINTYYAIDVDLGITYNSSYIEDKDFF